MPLFAPCHDAHGIPGDVAAGSGHGFSAVVAPADAAVRGVSKLDACLRLDVAVSAMFSERLDVALDCVGVRSVSELLAALGCLFLPNVSERILSGPTALSGVPWGGGGDAPILLLCLWSPAGPGRGLGSEAGCCSLGVHPKRGSQGRPERQGRAPFWVVRPQQTCEWPRRPHLYMHRDPGNSAVSRHCRAHGYAKDAVRWFH
jgi:hypothetical protein